MDNTSKNSAPTNTAATASRKKVPSAACISIVMNTLPSVWLKSQAYQNCIPNAPKRNIGGTDRLRRGVDAREPQAALGSWWPPATIGQPADEAERSHANLAPRPTAHSRD